MIHNRPYLNKKVTVILPCKCRDLSLFQILPAWFCQIKQSQIVIVDYSSHNSLYGLVRIACERCQKTLDYDIPHSDADCLILTVKNKSFFNMSHAINYAITKTSSDVISIAGCESLPAPYYLEIACNIIDDRTFTRCIRGRLTYPRKMVEDINGYPEMMEYWGGEDDVVAHQFVQKGATCIDLDYHMVRNMQTSDFHEPMPGYWNEEQNLNKQYASQESSIKYRNNLISHKFEGANKNKKAYAQYCKNYENDVINNYGKPYGDEDPLLLSPESRNVVIDVLPEIPHPDTNPRKVGNRCAVIIACCNRLDNVMITLPKWLSQLYQNKQIIIIDYNSQIPILPHIRGICEGHKVSLSYNEYNSDADVILFRLDNLEFFNISHAYNYAVKMIEADVLSFVCADSCPVDYYLDLVMHAVDDDTIVQMWWGLHTITYKNWEKLNGHQEFITGWGAEDIDFKDRSMLMGLKLSVLPQNYAYHIPQDATQKGIHREIKDISQSNSINYYRFSQYRATRGHVGNYGKEIGTDIPVAYIGNDNTEMCVLHVFEYFEVDESKLPDEAKKFSDTTFYVIDAKDNGDEFSAEWKVTRWQEWENAGNMKGHGQEFIESSSDIYLDKYISMLRDNIINEHSALTQIQSDKKEFYEHRRHKKSSLHNYDI